MSIAHERVLRLLREHRPLLREGQVRMWNVEAEEYHLFLRVLHKYITELYVHSCVKTLLLSFENHSQNAMLPTLKLQDGAIYLPGVPKTCLECFYTTLHTVWHPTSRDTLSQSSN